METKKTLFRDTDNKMLGGVASGLAEYMNWDITVVRLVFLFCLFAVQGSVLAYILAWIIVIFWVILFLKLPLKRLESSNHVFLS